MLFPRWATFQKFQKCLHIFVPSWNASGWWGWLWGLLPTPLLRVSSSLLPSPYLPTGLWTCCTVNDSVVTSGHRPGAMLKPRAHFPDTGVVQGLLGWQCLHIKHPLSGISSTGEVEMTGKEYENHKHYPERVEEIRKQTMLAGLWGLWPFSFLGS